MPEMCQVTECPGGDAHPRSAPIDESKLICLRPFYYCEISPEGDVRFCCSAWTKRAIGNVNDHTLAEIWNGEAAQSVRLEILSGEWRAACNEICPVIIEHRRDADHPAHVRRYQHKEISPELVDDVRLGKLRLDRPPTIFNLSNSPVCNLSCIMCSRDMRGYNPAMVKKVGEEIFGYLPTAREVVLTGHGDPLARPDSRKMLTDYHGENPNLRFNLITNALLIPTYWERIKHQRFGWVTISVDAATKETYEKIRVGGTWDQLQSAIALMCRERDHFLGGITVNMTVMRSNFREIPAFIDWAHSLRFGVVFQRVRGHCGDENIFEAGDQESISALREILSSAQGQARVDWGDLAEFMPVKSAGSLQ